jgi:hypothetical protein
MQVSKWPGHSSYVLTLSTYADYIREDDTAAPKFDDRLRTPTLCASIAPGVSSHPGIMTPRR